MGFATLPTGVSDGTNTETTVNITDSDVPTVIVCFEETSYTALEGGSVAVKVKLSADPERSETVPPDRIEQGGASSADYSEVPENGTFASGDTGKTFTISAVSDTVDDDDQSEKLGFGTLPTGVNPGTKDETMVSITDDDYPANVSGSFGAATYTAAEGSMALVKLTLSQAPERAVTILLSKTDQDGASASDYSGVPASVSFAATERGKAFIFEATQDSVDDDVESVKVELDTPPTGFSKRTKDHTVISITDDDAPQVTVSFESATFTVAEGSSETVK